METPETLKVLNQFPLAAKYLKANHYVVIVTPEDARPRELQTSTSLIINSSDNKIPNDSIVHELFSYCSEVADVLDIEDFQLGIRAGEEGCQTIIEIRLDDCYPIRARTPDDQRIDVYFETYDEFMTLYQYYFKSKVIDTLFKGGDSSKRGALLISDNPPPEGWTGKSITKSQLMGYGEEEQNSNEGGSHILDS